MNLSPLSHKAHAAQMATVILAPLAVCLACYAPAFAQLESAKPETAQIEKQNDNDTTLSPRPSIIGYLA